MHIDFKSTCSANILQTKYICIGWETTSNHVHSLPFQTSRCTKFASQSISTMEDGMWGRGSALDFREKIKRLFAELSVHFYSRIGEFVAQRPMINSPFNWMHQSIKWWSRCCNGSYSHEELLVDWNMQ